MLCPHCGGKTSGQVLRTSFSMLCVRRSRTCVNCYVSFSTLEVVTEPGDRCVPIACLRIVETVAYENVVFRKRLGYDGRKIETAETINDIQKQHFKRKGEFQPMPKQKQKKVDPPLFKVKPQNEHTIITPDVYALYKKVKKAIKKHHYSNSKAMRARLEKLIYNNIERLKALGMECEIEE